MSVNLFDQNGIKRPDCPQCGSNRPTIAFDNTDATFISLRYDGNLSINFNPKKWLYYCDKCFHKWG